MGEKREGRGKEEKRADYDERRASFGARCDSGGDWGLDKED